MLVAVNVSDPSKHFITNSESGLTKYTDDCLARCPFSSSYGMQTRCTWKGELMPNILISLPKLLEKRGWLQKLEIIASVYKLLTAALIRPDVHRSSISAAWTITPPSNGFASNHSPLWPCTCWKPSAGIYVNITHVWYWTLWLCWWTLIKSSRQSTATSRLSIGPVTRISHLCDRCEIQTRVFWAQRQTPSRYAVMDRFVYMISKIFLRSFCGWSKLPTSNPPVSSWKRRVNVPKSVWADSRHCPSFTSEKF